MLRAEPVRILWFPAGEQGQEELVRRPGPGAARASTTSSTRHKGGTRAQFSIAQRRFGIRFPIPLLILFDSFLYLEAVKTCLSLLLFYMYLQSFYHIHIHYTPFFCRILFTLCKMCSTLFHKTYLTLRLMEALTYLKITMTLTLPLQSRVIYKADFVFHDVGNNNLSFFRRPTLKPNLFIIYQKR